ncbi:unnamed protein product [Sphagnum jensenii]|uniref:TLC domain-containing protein n=1 Tax=Sphagnum jensenii TaxID=128206 RepID=A0ABP0WTH9_9BRYO
MTTMVMALEQLRNSTTGWIANKGGGDFFCWPNWDEETYPEIQDLVLIPLFAILFPTLRFFLDKFVFEPFGRRCIFHGQNGPGNIKKAGVTTLGADTDRAQKKLTKFKESAWKCVYYSAAEIFALAITYNEPWFTDSKMFWLGSGEQRWPNLMTRLKLKVLYGFAGGFYMYSIFALIFWETRRADFGVSMSHHVAALVLIVFSYLARFARVGSVVLAIHDASDVFLEIGKLTKYYGWEIVPSIVFVIFAISWVVLRLIYFPLHVIWSTSYEVLQLLDRSYKQGPVLYYIFNTLLISLFVLHIYWWILIFRMIVKQVEARGRVSDDVRSDDDDSDKED